MRQLEASLGVEEAEHSSLASVQSRVVSPSAESSNVNTSTSPEPPRTISSCSQHSIEDSRVLNDIMREQREKAEKEKEKKKEKKNKKEKKEREEQEAAEIQREIRQDTLKEEPELMKEKVVANGVVKGPEAENPALKALEKIERHRSRFKGKKIETVPPQISVTMASGEAPTPQLPDVGGGGCSEGGGCTDIVDRAVSRILNHSESSPVSSPRRTRAHTNGNGNGVTLAPPTNGSSSPRRGDGMERSQSHPLESDLFGLPALAAYELHLSEPDLHSSVASSSAAINQNQSNLSNCSQRHISIPNDQSAAHQNCPQPQKSHTNGDSKIRSPTSEPPPPAKLRAQSPVKISVNSQISISSPTKLSCATRVIMIRPTDFGANIPGANNNSQLFPCAGRASERETLAGEAAMKLNGTRGGCAQCAQENPSFEEGPEEVALETVVPRGSVTLLTQSPPSRGEAITRSVSQESFDSCAAGHNCRTKFCALM